jgi:hypothetical protein
LPGNEALDVQRAGCYRPNPRCTEQFFVATTFAPALPILIDRLGSESCDKVFSTAESLPRMSKNLTCGERLAPKLLISLTGMKFALLG